MKDVHVHTVCTCTLHALLVFIRRIEVDMSNASLKLTQVETIEEPEELESTPETVARPKRTRIKIQTCDVCKEEFFHKSQLLFHKKHTHHIDPFKRKKQSLHRALNCFVEKEFRRSYKRKNILDVNTRRTNQRSECLICERHFLFERTYQNHMRDKHSGKSLYDSL